MTNTSPMTAAKVIGRPNGNGFPKEWFTSGKSGMKTRCDLPE